MKAERDLTKALTTERPKRTFSQCVYCGRPCLGRTCHGHRPLLKLDPNVEAATAAKEEA